MELAKSWIKYLWKLMMRPGFVANRILMPMINEAIFALYEGMYLALRK
jgi:3-hydroxybutyryl-CoA dehydrogenase